MEIKYNIELPEKKKTTTKRSVESTALVEFLNDNSKTSMSLSYDDTKTATNKTIILKAFAKRSKITNVDIYRIDNVLYVAKI